MKSFLSIFLLFCILPDSWAQKKFSVLVTIDNSVNSHQVSINYHDGDNLMLVSDTFSNNALEVHGVFFAKALTFTVQYMHNITPYYQTFLIDSFPARLHFYMDTIKNDFLIKNNLPRSVINIVETENNPILRAIRLKNKKNTEAVLQLENGSSSGIKELRENTDSFNLVHSRLIKEGFRNSIEVLKKYRSSFYSLWYFRSQILMPSLGMFKSDTTFIRELNNAWRDIFWTEYANTVEGNSIQRKFEHFFRSALSVGDSLPLTYIQDISDNKIALKGKYILFDFWATWCKPCMQEISFIKDQNIEHAGKNLKIISISIDTDSLRFSKVIQEKKMNWVHVFDKYEQMKNIFKIDAIPTLIFADPNGKILFRSTGLDRGSEKELMKLLYISLNSN